MLKVRGFIQDDLTRLLRLERMDVSTDVAIAVTAFVTMCEGNEAHEPSYAPAARTMWRVEGAGQPSPYLNVFDWGGDIPGVPHLRIWYLDQGDARPTGLGAFAAINNESSEKDAVLRRLKRIKGNSCYLELDER